MAVYTALSKGEIAAFIRPLDLGTLHSALGVASGIENTNYFVDTATGCYVLTLFERLTADELPFYLHLMKHLAARGIPVPDPVADDAGEILHEINGKPAVIVNRLPGQSVMSPSLVQCRAVGEMLARMHVAGNDYSRHQPNPRGLDWWRATATAARAFLSPDQQSLLASEIAFQEQIALSAARIPQGPVHGDLFRDNVLFEGEQVSGVFDFYFAGIDALLFDIAVCLNDWCVGSGEHDGARVDAFLHGYEAVRRLGAAERSLLPAMRRMGALRFWLSRLSDLHRPREAALLNAHDPTHFERLLRAIRGEG
ncbi:homoserine kinase [Aminobacter aminovorans]|jgi:homoserine kinase type II|uniref:Homoserine kinase n=1 Tax=Aminobacter aminovorans TaxID=83263 RepID=A0AAC8YVK4_AMIAI|nr:homoserine kinase [Aminobacter aminovorans]AMS45084.1 Homoserine kinase [Aminobacter aminovorans]MBB3705161.1 homoserine kinase type II [Aminobacter aminovorans]